MATVYKIEIKTVSPFISYSEAYITEKFLKEYRDYDTDMWFESTEIDVERIA